MEVQIISYFTLILHVWR